VAAQDEIKAFLTSRRARIRPEQVSLPDYGGVRRVPGLRREEVAMLAGVSVDYYTRLERGRLSGVSDEVLHALANALQLDEAERAHLFHLAHTAKPTAPQPRKPTAAHVRPSVQRILDAMVGVPAWVRNYRLDFLAANELGYALNSEMLASSPRTANAARFMFLEPRARQLYPEWDRGANEIVATLRAEAGRDPFDKPLSDLIGELSTRSPQFRTKWAAHNVRTHRTGIKKMHHPIVGDLELTYEAMELPSHPGLTMFALTPEPGSASADALSLLASWAATRSTEEGGAEALDRNRDRDDA
jgi:transcriptional regulator with XRE-family HTH domain